jgi:hypothetical protein
LRQGPGGEGAKADGRGRGGRKTAHRGSAPAWNIRLGHAGTRIRPNGIACSMHSEAMDMKRSVLVMVVACLGLLAAAAAWADDAGLTVTQDESSMEQTIERYLKDSHGLKVTEKVGEGDDLWLELAWSGDPMPAYRMVIDTQSLNKNSEGRVIERGVRLQVLTTVHIPEAEKASALVVINGLNRDKVFSAVYLDSSNQVVLDWTLNVLGEGLPTECVYDMVVREVRLWQELYPLLSPLL